MPGSKAWLQQCTLETAEEERRAVPLWVVEVTLQAHYSGYKGKDVRVLRCFPSCYKPVLSVFQGLDHNFSFKMDLVSVSECDHLSKTVDENLFFFFFGLHKYVLSGPGMLIKILNGGTAPNSDPYQMDSFLWWLSNDKYYFYRPCHRHTTRSTVNSVQ